MEHLAFSLERSCMSLRETACVSGRGSPAPVCMATWQQRHSRRAVLGIAVIQRADAPSARRVAGNVKRVSEGPCRLAVHYLLQRGDIDVSDWGMKEAGTHRSI